jgi:hypothetical protein
MPAEKKNPLIGSAITWRKTGAEAVILDLDTSQYYSANETGTFVWELLSAGKKQEKIAAALAEEYGLTAGQAQQDTADFLKELAKLKIIAPEAVK